MTDTDRGGTTAVPEDSDRLEAWGRFERRLTAHIVIMTDEIDHLSLGLRSGGGAWGEPGAFITTTDEGARVHAEVGGNCHLAPMFALGDEQCAQMAEIGWTFHLTDEIGMWDTGDEPEMDNWTIDGTRAESARIASAVVRALRDVFGVAHPQLLSHSGWGPAREYVDELGIPDAAKIEVEPAGFEEPVVLMPRDRAALHEFVGDYLGRHFTDVRVYGDDYVVWTMGQAIRVRVYSEIPMVSIKARVAHGVTALTRAAAVLAVINVDSSWGKWTLRGDEVWAETEMFGKPFVPVHLAKQIHFLSSSVDRHRDRLVRDIGAKVG